MFDFIDVEQNTEEWLELRRGKITSSKLSCVMAHYGKSFGEPAKRYAKQIAVERLSGKQVRSGYSNDDMQRGHEQEPIARGLYLDEFFCTISNGGFFSSSFMGCSPDGLVNTDGLIEIKSVNCNIHYDPIAKSSYDTAYKWQLIGNLKFTGRCWLDFVSYCSDFPEGKQLYVYRLHKDHFKDEFKMIDNRLSEFSFLIDECLKNINESSYFNL